MKVAGARVCVAAAAAVLGAVSLLPAWPGVAADAGAPLGPIAAPAAAAARPKVPSQMTSPAALTTAMEPPAAGAAPSPAVYPPHALPLTFDHQRHAARGIGCEQCHAEATRSLTAKDNLLPGEKACRPCHAIDRGQPTKQVPAGQPSARCDACYPAFTEISVPGSAMREPARVVLPTANLKFNHKLHADRGVACGLCHAGVDQVAMATTAEMPKMGLCLGCHDGRQATARCAACHPTNPDGRLRVVFPSGRLAPSGSLRGADAHTATFRTQHKTAGRDERYCGTCHKQSECTDCHAAGVVKPADFHPLDYASLHAMDARRNTPNCSSCHRNQTFCLGCHQRLGVAPDPEGGQVGRQPNNPFGTGTGVKRFHPPGWVRDDSGVVLTTPTPASHSFQARRNLRTCVSCHREDSCLSCHSADPTRSLGVNPHPSGFATSAACRAMAAKNARACLKCHTPGDPSMACQ